MNSPAPITIVIPTYNGMRHIEECIQSALAQRGVDFEVWVGDDSSNDSTRKILSSFHDPRLRVLPGGENRGLFPNLNRLIRNSRSPYFHILCQDDVLEPNCLARELQFFSRYPRLGVIFAKTSAIDDDSQVAGYGELYDLPNVMRPELALQHFFYHGCIPSNLSTVGLRRTAYQELGGFDESFRVSGDYDLWARICETWDMGVIHEHLVKVRSHDAQLSKAHSSGPLFVEENRRIRERLVPQLPLSVQINAKKFEHWRYAVLDFHYSARACVKGRLQSARRVWKALGPKETLGAAMSWLVSLNNRLFRPRAHFVLPRNYQVGPL